MVNGGVVNDEPISKPMGPTQQPAEKKVLLVRPASSHQDLTSGFSYTNPARAPTLTLSSKSAETTSLESLGRAQSPKDESSRAQVQRTSPVAPNVVAVAVMRDDQARTNLSIEGEIQNERLTVPFPIPLISSAGEDFLRGPSPSRQNDAVSKEQESTHLGKDPSADPETSTLPVPVPIEPQSNNGAAQDIEDLQDGDSASPSKDLRQHLSGPAKKDRTAQNPEPNKKMTSWLRNQDDAIHMLMFNRQKHSQDLERSAATEEAQKQEIFELYLAKEELSCELKHSYQRLEESEGKLKEATLLKAQVQARLRTMKDFLNNLSAKHATLRDAGYELSDEMKRLRAEHQEGQSELQKMREAMSAIQESILRERIKWVHQLSQSENIQTLLTQQLATLKSELERAQVDASNEHVCSQRIDEVLLRTSVGHEQLTSSMKGYQEVVRIRSSSLPLC